MLGSSGGDWDRDAFAQQVLERAAFHGDDTALAIMLNTFPRLNVENARLWLTYMKDARARGKPLDEFVMNSFRKNDWVKILREGNGREFAVSRRPSIPTWNAQNLHTRRSPISPASSRPLSAQRRRSKPIPARASSHRSRPQRARSRHRRRARRPTKHYRSPPPPQTALARTRISR